MKKIIIVLFAMLFVVSSVFSFVSCDGSTEEKSPYDYLTDSERQIYLTIKNSLSNFKDPSSVKITKAAEVRDGLAFVEISAENSLGGAIKTEFVIFIKEYTLHDGSGVLKKGDMREFRDFLTLLSRTGNPTEDSLDLIDDVYSIGNTYDVGALNSALDEYKKESGWD